MLSKPFLYLISIGMFLGGNIFAQKIDTSKITLKPKSKTVNRLPQIKANIQPYKPNAFGFNSGGSIISNSTKPNKILSVLKVYPNPVDNQINISLRLDKETNLSIKITDLLGNDVMSLLNERSPAGEQTKTFSIPNKLNAGIYFLRIVANGEPIIKRISVL